MDKFDELYEQVYTVKEFSIDELIDNIDAQLITEGTNLEFRKGYKNIAGDVKESLKKAKSYAKEGKIKEYRDEIDKAVKYVQEYKQYLKDFNDTAKDAIFGSFLQLGCSTIESIADACKSTLITLGIRLVAKDKIDKGDVLQQVKADTEMNMFGEVIKTTMELSRSIKNSEEISPKVFNAYKNRLITCCDKLEKTILKFKSKIDKMKIKIGKIQESVDDIKLSVYESAQNGEITQEQKDLLLEMLGTI